MSPPYGIVMLYYNPRPIYTIARTSRAIERVKDHAFVEADDYGSTTVIANQQYFHNDTRMTLLWLAFSCDPETATRRMIRCQDMTVVACIFTVASEYSLPVHGARHQQHVGVACIFADILFVHAFELMTGFV